MITSRALGAALLAAALPTLAAAQELTLVPDFVLRDLAESKILRAYGAGLTGAARWDALLGFSEYPGAKTIVQASADGSVLLGWHSTAGAIHATLWTSTAGWAALPQPPGTWDDFMYPVGLSDDGDVAVGYVIAGAAPGGDPFGWRRTPMGGVLLLAGPNTEASDAACVSGDGAWIGGFRREVGYAAERAVRWDHLAKPFTVIPSDVPGSTTLSSSLRVLNDDGSLGAGSFGLDAFLWEQGVGISVLPRPPGADGFGLWPTAMSDDGELVVGFVPGSSELASWLWTPGLGTRWIADVAAQLDLDPGDSPVPFEIAMDCSASGRRIAGRQPPAAGLGATGWILELPADGLGAVIDLHKELTGDTTPTLAALGSFVGGTDVTLKLGHLLGLGTPTHLVIGLTALAAPFKGGIMVPNPDLVTSFAAPAAKFDIPLPWPANVPPLTSLYFQVWQPQPGGPVGWAASNALQVVTP